ncbi:MAG: site-specific DNA-methyltransferase [Candidatus Brocadiia bacterium]
MPGVLPQDNIVYTTRLGCQCVGDSRALVSDFRDDSIDLIMTSPPFALLRKKSYGNKDQDVYVEWLADFGREALPKLRETGSFVLDLGGAYKKGRPVRSLYNYRVLVYFVDILGYRLAEEFFWFNPAKLPSPIEWVNKRKIRVKDAVNTVWWFSKSDFPKADVKRVLKPYSDRMRQLIEDPDSFYSPKKRPSGHDVAESFARQNRGAIPPNLLEIANTASNSHYMRVTKDLGRRRHPARFPEQLPRFFIEFLTEPGDLVVDLFAGSNTTGYVAEMLGRRWVAIEKRLDYAALSAVRFMEGCSTTRIANVVRQIEDGKPVDISAANPQQQLFEPHMR